MKRNSLYFLRLTCVIGIFILVIWGMLQLSAFHQESCPQLYVSDQQYGFLSFVIGGIFFALAPLTAALLGKLCGYQLFDTWILFLHINWKAKGRIRLSKPAFGTFMLPPDVSGDNPCWPPVMALPLHVFTIGMLSLLLIIPCWQTPASQQLLYLAILFFALTMAVLLPRKKGTDPIAAAIAFGRSRDLRRAYACALHIAAARRESRKLTDMPDEWFQTYPADTVENLYVSNCLVNGSSRLIRQYRFTEAYDMLRPLLTLKPGPDTHESIAYAILNGAICEALAEHENGAKLPTTCLNQLEHDSVKYMLPPSWNGRLLTAKYARALFIHHDEAEAAALLDEIKNSPEQMQTNIALLTLMQEKVGVNIQEASHG